MGLSNLPAVVLDVLVEFAGREQGWRLEIASPSLKASSMECAAIRLGKCRWVGDDRQGVAFRPSWRHVAAATRRGPYLLRCGPPRVLGSDGEFFGHRRYMDFRGLRASRLLRREAPQFIIKPASRAWPGEGTIHRSWHGRASEEQLGFFDQTYQSTWFRGTMQGSHREGGHLIGVWTNPECQWLLNLESRTSHLPFRRGRGESRGRLSSSTLLALTAETAADTEFQVDHWELVPAMLAADERFEWSTNVPHAHYRRDSHYRCDSHRGAAMRALQRPVSPTTELLNDVADDVGTPTYQPPSVMPPTSKSGAWCVNGAEAELEDGNICKIIKINAQKNMATVALKATQALTRSLPTSLLVRVKPKAGDKVRVVDGSAVYDAELLAIEDGDGIIQVDNGEYKIIDFSAIAKVADF